MKTNIDDARSRPVQKERPCKTEPGLSPEFPKSAELGHYVTQQINEQTEIDRHEEERLRSLRELRDRD